MKEYKYIKVESYNKCSLVIEVTLEDSKYSYVSVYPVTRLTHYRYILNYRLNGISDYLDEQLRNGHNVNDVKKLIAVGKLSIGDGKTEYKYINYGKNCMTIVENKWMYSVNDIDMEFKVSGLDNKSLDKCKYFTRINSDSKWKELHYIPNKMSLKRLNDSKSSRFYHIFHLLDVYKLDRPS